MQITIASKNPAKIDATKEVFKGKFADIDFLNVDVSSEVSSQPIGLDETVRGAKNRAKNSFNDCDISVGIESGVISPDESRYMIITACVLFDGNNYYIGLSHGFCLPIDVSDLMKQQSIDVDLAVHKVGLSDDPRTGYKEGIIGIMTNGKLTRKEYTKSAIQMALVDFTFQHNERLEILNTTAR